MARWDPGAMDDGVAVGEALRGGVVAIPSTATGRAGRLPRRGRTARGVPPSGSLLDSHRWEHNTTDGLGERRHVREA